MLLAIDNGNTNVKFALVNGANEIVHRWRIATDTRRTADEYAVWLHQLLELEGFSRADVGAVMMSIEDARQEAIIRQQGREAAAEQD